MNQILLIKQYIDKLDDIVNKYKNIYYSTIKKKPVDLKSNILTLVKKINDKDPTFLAVDLVRISKHKTFLQKVL